MMLCKYDFARKTPGAPLSGPIIKRNAYQFNKKLGAEEEEFQASEG